MTKILNVELVRETFEYDPLSGILLLKKDRGRHNRFKKGTKVGTLHECGARTCRKHYLRVQFDGAYVYVHRLIWVWMTGKQPDEIDHLDGNGLNNKWGNLRDVAHKCNSRNQKKHKTNTSGKSGVTCRKDSGRWRARIMVDDKSINLGTFGTKDEAIAARVAAEHKYGFTTGEN